MPPSYSLPSLRSSLISFFHWLLRLPLLVMISLLSLPRRLTHSLHTAAITTIQRVKNISRASRREIHKLKYIYTMTSEKEELTGARTIACPECCSLPHLLPLPHPPVLSFPSSLSFLSRFLTHLFLTAYGVTRLLGESRRVFRGLRWLQLPVECIHILVQVTLIMVPQQQTRYEEVREAMRQCAKQTFSVMEEEETRMIVTGPDVPHSPSSPFTAHSRSHSRNHSHQHTRSPTLQVYERALQLLAREGVDVETAWEEELHRQAEEGEDEQEEEEEQHEHTEEPASTANMLIFEDSTTSEVSSEDEDEKEKEEKISNNHSPSTPPPVTHNSELDDESGSKHAPPLLPPSPCSHSATGSPRRPVPLSIQLHLPSSSSPSLVSDVLTLLQCMQPLMNNLHPTQEVSGDAAADCE